MMEGGLITMDQEQLCYLLVLGLQDQVDMINGHSDIEWNKATVKGKHYYYNCTSRITGKESWVLIRID